jgi:CRISPR-associated protein Csd1
MALDNDSKNLPYRLGRLFAALEYTQQTALGKNINATIKDRFFASACATPARVFPHLMSMNQHHMKRIKSDPENKKYAVRHDRMIGEILEGIEAFRPDGEGLPKFLGPDDQGLFALGYYHQKQSLYSSSKETREED